MKKMKKILGLGFFTIVPFAIILIVIIAVLGGEVKTSGYVENNFEYAAEFKTVLNKYIPDKKGYVSLGRIIFFYLENPSLSFDEIYRNNLDENINQMKPISDVCNEIYKDYSVCNSIDDEQIDEYTYKPFNSPIDYSGLIITSYFGHDRIVNNKDDTHYAWDIVNSSNDTVYSVCDGTVKNVSFPFKENVPNESSSCGNTIVIECEVNGLIYVNTFCHLYPNSAKVKTGDKVTHWQAVARYGNTGYSFGSHLHWQTSLNGTRIDSFDLVNFNLIK